MTCYRDNREYTMGMSGDNIYPGIRLSQGVGENASPGVPQSGSWSLISFTFLANPKSITLHACVIIIIVRQTRS